MKKKHILMIILAFFLLFALSRIDRESLFYSITQIPLRLILVLLGLQIITQLLINFQWYKIAKLTDIPMGFRDMLYINCQGAVMDSITPGVKIGGEVTRAVQISRISKCSGEQSAALVALQKLFSVSALLFILLFAVGYLIGEIPWLSARHMQLLVYGALSLLLIFFACIFIMPHRIKTYMQSKKNPRGFLFVLLDGVGSVRKNKKACAMLVSLSLFIWILYPVKMYLLTVQFYPEAHSIHIAAITFAAYMVAMLPIFPGGLGGFEGTMTGLLAAMGIMVSDAAVITIVFRFATFWFVMIAALVFIAFFNFCQIRRS